MRRQVKRPTVKSRKSACHSDTTIVEVTAPDGTGLLISIGPHRDGKGLVVRPYRADPTVRLALGSRHKEGCALYTSHND